MAKRYWTWVLALYGLGAGLSQSLMSLGSILVLLGLVVELGCAGREGPRALGRAGLVTLASVVAYMLICGARLLTLEAPLDVSRALGALPLFAVPLIAFFPAFREQRVPDWTWVLGAAGLGALVSAGWGLSQVLFLGQAKAVGFMGNPIYYAYTLLPALGFFVLLAEQERAHRRRWAYAACLLLWAALLVSASRTAFLCATAFIMLRLVAGALKDRRAVWALIAFVVVGSASLGLALRYSPHFETRFRKFSSYERLRRDSSWKGRCAVWAHNWLTFQEHPWLGTGPRQNAIDAGRDRAFRKKFKPGFSIYAHSAYLQALAESGLVGSLLLLVAVLGFVMAFPAALPWWALVGAGALTENVLTNSRPMHAHLFYLILACAVLRRSLRERSALRPSVPSSSG